MSKRFAMRHWLAIVFAAAFLLPGCSQNDSASKQGSAMEAVDAKPSSPELLEHSYGYLTKGDGDFRRLAPNYSTLRPFAPDTAIVVETRSEVEGVDAPADYNEYLHVRLNRPMSIRLVVADSTGNGLIVYEWDQLPVGAYTIGAIGWPVPQVELLEEHNWVYVYVVADTRFRYRTRFRLDEDRHFVPLIPASNAS